MQPDFYSHSNILHTILVSILRRVFTLLMYSWIGKNDNLREYTDRYARIKSEISYCTVDPRAMKHGFKFDLKKKKNRLYRG